MLASSGRIETSGSADSCAEAVLLTKATLVNVVSSMARDTDCWGAAEEQKHELSQGRLWPSGEQGALWESCGADESAHRTGQAIAAEESVETRISLKNITMMLAAR